MIDLLPNKTLFIQLGTFLVTFLSLKYLIFKPVLRLIELRRQKTIGAEQVATELHAKTESMITEYQKRIQAARQAGLTIKEKLKKQGEEQAGEILRQGRNIIDDVVEKSRQEILQQSKEAQLLLKKQSRDLAREMAEKLLGRRVAVK